MSRDELINKIISIVGATTPEQIAKINNVLSDIILVIQLRHQQEILISELSAGDIRNITDECIRRYRL